ncbi:hypothetical protein ABZ135_21330 [Streptomyces sp. NPDC006339]|uniref:hypothetical protein n=1 Tax=Streptomyces sp. NPDC006339 TaxID=3156755 RepID=UPI0033A4FBED
MSTPQRGSDTSGPRLDDARKKEVEDEVRSGQGPPAQEDDTETGRRGRRDGGEGSRSGRKES